MTKIYGIVQKLTLFVVYIWFKSLLWSKCDRIEILNKTGHSVLIFFLHFYHNVWFEVLIQFESRILIVYVQWAWIKLHVILSVVANNFHTYKFHS